MPDVFTVFLNKDDDDDDDERSLRKTRNPKTHPEFWRLRIRVWKLSESSFR